MLLAPLAGCSMAIGSDGTAGTGSGSTRDFAVSGFDAVKLTGSDNVRVKIGKAFAVHAEGPSKLLDALLVERDGDTLKVGRKSRMGFSWGRSGTVTITVTMPAIVGASVTGSGDLSVDRAQGDRFKGATTGSGNLDIANLDVKNADLSVTGSGDIAAAGKAAALALSVTGSGDIDATRVQASGGTVSIMGSGNVNAAINGAVSVSIMGSGDADLGPRAKCSVNKLGSGNVRCGS